MKIPLVDLKAQYSLIKGEIDEAIWRVIESGQFILGPEVKEFVQFVRSSQRGVERGAVGAGDGDED